MGAGLEVVTRSAKKSYEERVIKMQRGIDSLLFPDIDADTSSSFLLDTYVSSPYAVAYTDPSNQSVVREFVNGSGQLITPPTARAKTPLDETLLDQLTSGLEPTAPLVQQTATKVDRIMGDHLEGHTMTRWYQALNVIIGASYKARGTKGGDLGLDIAYSRDAGNSLTYDFTATSATMAEAIKDMQDRGRAKNMPMSRNILIGGSDWLSNFSTDSNILEMRKANPENVLVSAQMEAPELLGVQGLVVHSVLRDPSFVAPVWICSFSPSTDYIAYKGATPEVWVPTNKAIMFSLNDKRWTVRRGIRAFNNAGIPVTTTGEVVADSFNESDPIVEIVRTQSKNVFVPGNINHTVVSTGTFS